MIEEKACGAVILRRNSEDDFDCLLIKHLAGHWGFPKGHEKENESEEETAIRKVKEETGYDCLIDNQYRGISSYLSEDGIQKQVIYYVGKIIGGENKPSSSSIEKAAWIPYAEALALLAYRSDVNILRNVRKYMTQFEEEK